MKQWLWSLIFGESMEEKGLVFFGSGEDASKFGGNS